ncbi:MAG: response regulator transcription factor [Steroidobacteraceae bacterium]|jgi:DNA-binding response OmpR family regulator|nr:response regulator transcription factor [Steroidobacteraceae bacterium]
MRVLIVEDDPLVGDAVRRALEANGYAVDLTTSAEAASSALHAESFDLAVVDIGLPRASGLQFVREQRRRGAMVPVLMLTARDGLDDRVCALDLGADDYLTKPFQVPELVARCRALIRRANALSTTQLTFGVLRLDLAHREVTLHGNVIDLTHREWSILECLVLNASRIVSKERLKSAVVNWSEDLTPNAIEVYISRLRAKLGGAVDIRAIRGMGYRIDAHEE